MPTGHNNLCASEKFECGFIDLLRHMPTGYNDFRASENKTIRNLEFLYETSFENMSVKLYSLWIIYVWKLSWLL